MGLGKHIRAHRQARGWTLEELEERSGVATGTIHALEQRDSSRSQFFPALAKAFGLSVEALAQSPDVTIAAEPTATYAIATTDDEFTIPQYEAGGAMGRGLVLEARPPGVIKQWKVNHEWLRLNVGHYTAIENLGIVTGFGNSMRGMFNPGDPLLCDCGVHTVELDGVYFFRVDSHGFIKILQRIPTEEGVILRAKSKNPDYEPFDVTPRIAASEGFEVFGRILTVWKSEQL